jgi:hypothetical protein
MRSKQLLMGADHLQKAAATTRTLGKVETDWEHQTVATIGDLRYEN